MKILVTGAKGMLGTNLCAELKKKHSVTGIDIGDIDLTKPQSVESLVKYCPVVPDLIIHAAAYTNVDGCERDPDTAYAVNGLGTRHVALSCQRLDIPLLYISTDFVFDGAKSEPYYEWDAVNPLNHYGRSKLAGEACVRDLLTKFFIVRTSWLFGKHGKNFVSTILKNTGEAGEIKVVDDQTGSPTYAPDLCNAIARLIDTQYYGLYHITNSGSCTWHAFASEAVRIKGIKASVLPISSDEYSTPTKRPKYSVLKNFCWERTFSPILRSWRDALKEYLA
ncbi:MAG: dTDP-4-dehydrorhamnose reductase [Candidatus Edwardsbacteria bacterium]|nr:dTDP-4-dehydrorhamnose reductase [Candidatus Edwardsbacteria bacterium]